MVVVLPSSSPATRLSERVARLCARAQDPLELFDHVAALVRTVVPYTAAGWILIDPDTMLMNGVYAEGVDRDLHLELIAHELTVDDINKFWELARRGTAAAALSVSTEGDLRRSARWARFYGPNGYGDELRAVFATGRVAWGHACLSRDGDDPFFSPHEVELVASIAPHVAHGIRTCYLLGDLTGAGPTASPALVMLADDGSVESATPQAVEWLGAPDDPLLETTIVLHEVANWARLLAEGDEVPTASPPWAAPGLHQPVPPALARVRSRTGEWLVVRGVRMPRTGLSSGAQGTTALVLEPARRADLAPLLVRLRQLTDREREVTQLLLVGMSTARIAHELWISPETLRGHVKSVFSKLGVSSRPELAALLSQEPRVRVRPDATAGRRSP